MSSAAEMMLEVGALTTITPAAVAAVMSTLSSPTPARATTLSCLAWLSSSASTVGRTHHESVGGSDVGEQTGPVRTVGLTNFEVGAEGLDSGWRKFFS